MKHLQVQFNAPAAIVKSARVVTVRSNKDSAAHALMNGEDVWYRRENASAVQSEVERIAREKGWSGAYAPTGAPSVPTVKSSRNVLRARCKKSPGFLRLLKLAASEQLKGNAPSLKASNPAAQRALEFAVCKLRQQTEIDTDGHAARLAYLMRNGKTWTEVHKASAVKAMKATTPDTLGVMSVWVYSPTISHRAAAELVKCTAPDSISSLLEDAAVIEFKENRARNTDKRGDNAQNESAGLAPWEEETAEYNDAGVLEDAQRAAGTRAERTQDQRAAGYSHRPRASSRRGPRVYTPDTPPRSTKTRAEVLRVHPRLGAHHRPRPCAGHSGAARSPVLLRH